MKKYLMFSGLILSLTGCGPMENWETFSSQIPSEQADQQAEAALKFPETQLLLLDYRLEQKELHLQLRWQNQSSETVSFNDVYDFIAAENYRDYDFAQPGQELLLTYDEAEALDILQEPAAFQDFSATIALTEQDAPIIYLTFKPKANTAKHFDISLY